MNKTADNGAKIGAKLVLCAFVILFAVALTGAFSLPKRRDFYPAISEDTADDRSGKTFSEWEEQKVLSEKSEAEKVSPVAIPEEINVSAPLPIVAINNENNIESPHVMIGFEKVSVFDVSSGNIVVMPFEEYVLGVLLSEMPTSFEPEALKAQAIACRTYTVYKQSMGISHENGAQLCTSPSHCQAFCDPERVSAERYEKAKAAVEGTKGEIMYYDGVPVLAVFHASSDGKTCSSEEVWGGRLPYLLSVDTAECFNPTMDITKEYTFSASVFSDKIGVSSSELSNFSVEKSASGRVVSVKIGDKSISGGDFVRIFGLRSHSFDVSVEETVVITCGGYGHGVGLSQYGAQDMAQKGYTCREILAHYYTGVNFVTIAG